MRKGGFQDERKERKRQLLEYLVKNTSETEEWEAEKIVSLFSWQWGLTPGKVREYLNELRALGAVKGSKAVRATKFAKTLLGNKSP